MNQIKFHSHEEKKEPASTYLTFPPTQVFLTYLKKKRKKMFSLQLNAFLVYAEEVLGDTRTFK